MINTAIEVALEAHKNQFRKGTKIPYGTLSLAVGITNHAHRTWYEEAPSKGQKILLDTRLFRENPL